jgi:1,2-diacylglycerol 3-alpha-glucosyltransferase
MRIGMMVDSYKPYVSGITNYIDINKRYLELAGHDVFIFTFGDLEYKDSEPRVIHSRGVPLSDSGFYLSTRYSTPARKLLQSMDIVHVHHPFLSGRLALRYCRPRQIPIVFTNHTRYDLYAQAYLPMMPEEMSQGLLQAYMPSFCEAVDLVIAPSAGMEKILRQLNVEGYIAVAPNGVDLKNFHEAKPFSRAELGYKTDDILLVYAGRLAPEKNLPFLLKSFAGVAQTLPNTYLLLIGSGIQQFEEEVRNLVEELELTRRVHFTGRVAYDQLPAYLAMCNIFVTASISEVHPLSVIEAMGAGLPVMGIHSVGVGDTVRDGITGFLATHDLPAFTAKLTRLCIDLNLRAQMGAAAQKASSAYAIERTTHLMLEHYEKLMREYKPRKGNWAMRLQRLMEKSTNGKVQKRDRRMG